MANQQADDDDDDRPIELPILKHPTRGSIRYQQNKQKGPTNQSQQRPRDPRFDPHCSGTSDIRHFAKNYAFLDDIRHKEIEQLEKALRKEKDAGKKDQLRLTLNRLRNKVVENKNKQKRLQVIDELKSSPGKSNRSRHKQSVGRRDNVGDEKQDDSSRGRPSRVPRPNKYVKKSDIKKRMLVEKYKELKEAGKLSKYLERKRKKLINRDEARMG